MQLETKRISEHLSHNVTGMLKEYFSSRTGVFYVMVASIIKYVAKQSCEYYEGIIKYAFHNDNHRPRRDGNIYCGIPK